MQPNVSVAVTRPWNWGIAVLSDPELGGEIPDVDPDAPVSANRNGIIVLVRHAQDVEAPDDADDDDELPSAEALVTVTVWDADPTATRPGTTVHQGTLDSPSGVLVLGDADHEVQLPAPQPRSWVRVWAPAHDNQPEQVWIDVWPAQ